MYDSAGAQREALNLKPLGPPNLRDPYAANFISPSRAQHKILKSYLKF